MTPSEVFLPPTVSIIIPVFNGADFLSEAIDSALSQTYKSFEVLVINDGSTDNGATERVAGTYGNRIRYFEKPNGGVASALNFGIREMRGDYLSWLSHDDLYVADKIEREIEFLFSKPAAERACTIVYSDYSVFTKNPQASVPVIMPGVNPEEFRYWLTIENCLHGCTLLIPREVFNNVGFFDESLKTTQDYDLWFRMAATCHFLHLPGSLVKARSHERQGTKTMSAVVKEEGNRLLSRFVTCLTEEELKRGARKSLPIAYAHIAASLFKRGYSKAGTQAARLALSNSITTSPFAVLKVLWVLVAGLIGSRALKPLRACLPGPLRTSLRQRLLKYKSSKVLSSPEALSNLGLKERFSKVYTGNIFRGRESRSGAGSDLVQTEVVRSVLPNLLREYRVCTFVDAPCGDWFWMREVNLPVEQYIGIDIVDSLIERNQKDYGSKQVKFVCADLASDPLPPSDLILSRDCLVHLSFGDALKILANFKNSGAEYLLTTTFVDRRRNEDLGDGFWRVLNMQLPPFNFPAPVALINENCTEDGGVYGDKCLGLWRLQDLSFDGDR